MGQSFYCSASYAGMWERKAMVMSPPATCDSEVWPCFHGCLAFLHRHPPTTVFSLTSPHSVSLQSTAALNLGLLHSPLTPDPAAAPPGDQCCCLVYGCGKACLILFPFRRPQISCFPLSLKCFSSDSDSCPAVGIRPLPQVPTR